MSHEVVGDEIVHQGGALAKDVRPLGKQGGVLAACHVPHLLLLVTGGPPGAPVSCQQVVIAMGQVAF